MNKEIFREDLLHRINAVKIELPNLKNRKSDIINLAEHFMRYYSQEYKSSLKVLNDDVKKVFLKYDWPGNIRELQNVCKYLSVMSVNSDVVVADLPRELVNEGIDSNININWEEVFESWILSEFNKDSKDISKNIDSIYESILIKSALTLSEGNKTEAARILGWGRNTISNKMKSIEK